MKTTKPFYEILLKLLYEKQKWHLFFLKVSNSRYELHKMQFHHQRRILRSFYHNFEISFLQQLDDGTAFKTSMDHKLCAHIFKFIVAA